MGKVEKYEKLNKPGLWFMRSIQPAKELGRYVYELTVELGRLARFLHSHITY